MKPNYQQLLTSNMNDNDDLRFEEIEGVLGSPYPKDNDTGLAEVEGLGHSPANFRNHHPALGSTPPSTRDHDDHAHALPGNLDQEIRNTVGAPTQNYADVQEPLPLTVPIHVETNDIHAQKEKETAHTNGDHESNDLDVATVTLDMNVAEKIQVSNSPAKSATTDALKKKASKKKRFDTKVEVELTDKEQEARQELIRNSTPTTPLEIALAKELERRNGQIARLSGEVIKLKQFISKRKQTYKRKRKEDGAPTRALSAYNIFVQYRFEQLAKENEEALMSSDSDAKMRRVPPASLVARTGNEWRDLDPEKKATFHERAKKDRKRYDEEMEKYQPPERQMNKKRNKTGYNMFFTHHVQEIKKGDTGVPSERGSVARLVGSAWKALSTEQRQFFEEKADEVNDALPSDEDEDNAKENVKIVNNGNSNEGVYPPSPGGHMLMGAMGGEHSLSHHGMPPQMGHAPVVHPHPQPHPHPHPHGDPRMALPPYPPPPPGHGPYPPHPHPYPYEYYPPPIPPHPPGASSRGGPNPPLPPSLHPPYYPHPPHYPPPPFHEPPPPPHDM